MSFNTRIKALRGNLTMQEFGEKIKTKVPTISAWENSGTMPSIQKLIELSKYLNVSTDYLLDLTDDNSYVITKNSFNSLSYESLEDDSSIFDDNPTAIINYFKDYNNPENDALKHSSYILDEYGDIKAGNTIPDMPIKKSMSMMNLSESFINYIKKPVNTLLFSKARSGLQLSYLNPTINMIAHSKDKKNIINNSDKIKFDLLPDLTNLGYQTLNFTKQLNGANKSHKFNILENLKSIIHLREMFLIFTNSIISNSNIQTDVITKKSIQRILTVYLREYLSSNLNNPVSFELFNNYLTENLKNKSNKKNRDLKITQEIIAELSNDTYVKYMDSDNTNYLKHRHYLKHRKPMFINLPIEHYNYTDDNNMMNLFKMINVILKYYLFFEADATQWITDNFSQNFNPYDLSISLGRNQSFIIIAGQSDIEYKDGNNMDLILANCDLIVNYDPENSFIRRFISQKTKVSATINKYSIFNDKIYNIFDVEYDNNGLDNPFNRIEQDIDQLDLLYGKDEVKNITENKVTISVTKEQIKTLSEVLNQLNINN